MKLLSFHFIVIEEWLKGEIIQDSVALRKYPSIVQYIVGHMGDGNPVVKVFLRHNDVEAMLHFKKCCRISEDMRFEFVNIANSKNESNESKNQFRAVDVATRHNLKQCIDENSDKICATYTNVVGVGPGVSITDHGTQYPCIILYCLDTTLIPFGEKPLPRFIEGFPCKFRESIALLGTCCKSGHFVMPGCSIGPPSTASSGSVGFLVESGWPINEFGCGFLTASHVAINDFLSNRPNKNMKHLIVHPSWKDNNHIDNTVGEVFESFAGNFGIRRTGIDIAAVKTYSGAQTGNCVLFLKVYLLQG